MKIQYRFVTGEILEIEVGGELASTIASIEKQDKNRSRAETRRHTSLEALMDMGYPLTDEWNLADVVEQFMTNEQLYGALATLQPEQRKLLQRVYVECTSLAEIAREEGVKYQSIQDRIGAILLKLKKSF